MEKIIEAIDKLNKVHENYSVNSSKDTLNELLEIYQEINPDWIKEYNRREEEKLKYRKTQSSVLDKLILNKLPNNFDVSKIKSKRKIGKNDEQIDPIELGRIIHISNKIAHTYESAINNIINEYVMAESRRGRDFVGYREGTRNGRIVDIKFEKDLKFIYRISDTEQKEYQEPIDEYKKAEDEINKKKISAKRARTELIKEMEKYEKCGVSPSEFSELFSERRKVRSLERKGKTNTSEYSETSKKAEELLAKVTEKVPEDDVIKLEKKAIKERNIRIIIAELEKERDQKKTEMEKNNRTNRIARKRKGFMNNYDFTQKDFDFLDSKNLQKMWKAYSVGMNIKNMAIEQVNRIIKERKLDDVSYGVAEERDKIKTGNKLFYMDIPEYGQFSVHFMPAIIGDSDFPEYKMSFEKAGRREQIMLTNQHSKEFLELIEDTYKDPDMDDIIGLDEVLEDGTRKPKNGVDVPEDRKQSYRKLYQILFLDLGNQRKDLEIRKSIRHQLGVSIGLKKEFLECLYRCDKCEDLSKRINESELTNVKSTEEKEGEEYGN